MISETNVARDINVTNFNYTLDRVSDETKTQAIRLVTETATMTFVDMMRLLSVSSSDRMFQNKNNIDRYDEFVGWAKDRFKDFKKQQKRLVNTEDYESIDISEKIKRQFTLLWRYYRKKPARPKMEIAKIRTMQALGENIHNLCMYSGNERYIFEMKFVEKKLADILATLRLDESKVTVVDVLHLRLYCQQIIIDEYATEKLGLNTVADDAVYDLGFFYFIIDYFLLPYARS